MPGALVEESQKGGRAAIVALALVVPAAALVDVASREAEAAFADQFVWPMGGTITSIYWECRSSCARWHRGVDVANGCDTSIYAARAGTVKTVAYDSGGYGNYVVLDHDNGYESLYAHMKSTSVSVGNSVTTSTVLGIEGSTGASTGCHVHFEVRQDDNGPSVTTKQFVPGKINDRVTRGNAVPYAMAVRKISTTTDVLDGPNLSDVSGEGRAVIGTAQAGEHYVTWSTWTNGAGETWYAGSFNGRVGWIRASHTAAAGGTAQRVTTDGVLNVRSGAGSSNTDVGDVHGGQEYVRLASATDPGGATWYKVHYDGSDGAGVGWIHGGYTTAVTYAAPATTLAGKKIAVDAGHGGTDPGASGYGLDEKTVTLDVALRLRDLLQADGATVVMTRTTDATVSLADRVATANSNNVDRFVSVHANSCGSCGGKGTETYYHSSLPSTSTSADLAREAQKKVVALLGTNDRGVKTADFYVLRETNMPAILVETAFIDQADDNALLASATKRQEFARAILHGVQVHFGLEAHDPPGGTPPPPPTPAGFFDDFEGADKGWTATNSAGSAAWATTTARASSGSKSKAIRNYGANENDALTTPEIDTAGLTSPKLTLKSWMEGERSCWLFGCSIADYGKVEVTSDGGSTWRSLKDQYWSSVSAWESLSFDLAQEAGKKIKVRFTFKSDGSTQNEGWYVDDVKVAASGGTTPPPSATFFDDFEGADKGWTATNSGGSAAWATTTARASSGSKSKAIRNYGANENDALTSPEINLAGLSAPKLTLKSWMDGEESCWLLGCSIADYGKIEITSNGGSSWRTLTTEYWSSDGAWESLTYDLNDEAGKKVKIRFTFKSDGSTQNEGWYVDDVKVA